MTRKQVILLNLSGKKPVRAEYKLENLSFFKLDLTNPRFNHLDLKTESEEEKKILEDKDTKVLLKSILASNGISEPIIAKEDGTVIEGNRRVVCLREIKKKYENKPELFPPEGYEKIPTYIFPTEIDPVEQSIYLARLHVSGKKEWDAFNQAKYIYSLKEIYHKSFDEIADLIGMSKGKVFQKYWAFIETKKFLKKYPQESINKYSFFEEAYKKKNIKDFIEGQENKKEFYDWIIKKKLNGAVEIRQLSKIKEDPKLFTLFKKEGITEAYHQYQALDKLKSDKDKKLIKETISFLKNIPRGELSELPKDKEKINLFKELKKELETLLSQIK